MYIGIDPGMNGGIAVLTAEGKIVTAYPMPDAHNLADRMELYADHVKHCFVEQVSAMPKQGVGSMFRFGYHCGVIEGTLIAFKIPFSHVTPFTWQRTMHAGISRKSFSKPKQRSLRAVRQLFPSFNLVPEGRRVEHDGIVDAILIGEYGRRASLAPEVRDGTIEDDAEEKPD